MRAVGGPHSLQVGETQVVILKGHLGCHWTGPTPPCSADLHLTIYSHSGLLHEKVGSSFLFCSQLSVSAEPRTVPGPNKQPLNEMKEGTDTAATVTACLQCIRHRKMLCRKYLI